VVETDISTKENSLPEAGSPPTERESQNVDHRFMIRTTDSFRIGCRELSQKLGCKLETVVGDILSVGYKSIEALSNGNKRVIVSIKDHKLVVEGLKDKNE
jgi:hypothetical protein